MDDPFNDPFWRSLLCDVQLTDAVSEEPDVPVTGSDAVAPAGVAAPPAAEAEVAVEQPAGDLNSTEVQGEGSVLRLKGGDPPDSASADPRSRSDATRGLEDPLAICVVNLHQFLSLLGNCRGRAKPSSAV
ncbi:TPA: hypothetical protein ACH3X2_010533 [Trebouxia sp. C0005]